MRRGRVLSVQSRLGDASSLGKEGKEGPRYEGLGWCSE